MILAIVLTGSALIFSQFLLAFLLKRAIGQALATKEQEIRAEMTAALHEWIDLPADGKKSKLGEALDAGGQLIGSAAAKSLLASLSGSASRPALLANNISEPLEAQANPLLSLLTGNKRGKGAAVVRLAELLGPMLTGGLGKNGGAGPGPGPGQARLPLEY